MNRVLRVLHIEDSEQDVALIARHLSQAGYDLISERVETAGAMKTALETTQWQVILCDYSLPQFNALGALALAKEMRVDLPFIIISGTIGEPVAVEAMRAGAHDYLMKDNLVRLGPIIERELNEAENRSARRKAEQQLRLQSVAMESAANAIMITDEEGSIVWVNYAFTETTGHSKDEVLGRNPRFLKSGKQDQAFYQNMWDTILAGKIWHDTLINRRKDGTFNHEDMIITPIRHNDGTGAHFVAIKHDITEKTLAQEALQASELRYRRLFESAKDGILILNADTGRIVDVNPYLSEMLGFSKEELTGKEVWEIGPFKDIVASKAAFAQLREQGYIRHENLPLESREGHLRQVEFVSNNYLAGSRVIQCNVRDISERKLAEEELRRTNQHLEGTFAELQIKTQELAEMTQQLWQASKLATTGELAASIAHELNNPLATLALHAEFLLAGLPDDDPKRRAVKVIEQEVERMGTLVSNLLLFSRRSQPEISTINMAEELQNSIEFIRYHLRTRNITLATEFADDLPGVRADRQQLRQVFLNLLTNANDAMPEGGTLTIRARRGVPKNGAPTIVVEFSDSGIGIKPEYLPRLWESFFTTKPEGKGTGLGLPICRRTIEEHRGTIGVESLPGKGTTVRIIMPAMETGAIKT